MPLTWRDTQMPTSLAPSRVPPNQAVTRPSRVSAMVEACTLGNGADSKMNSTFGGACAAMNAPDAGRRPAARRIELARRFMTAHSKLVEHALCQRLRFGRELPDRGARVRTKLLRGVIQVSRSA